MKRILIIEDDFSILESLSELLEQEGFETIVSVNGRLGLEMAQTNPPDLILCDLMIPELNGYEVLSQVRQCPQTQNLPFIFLTGQSDLEAIRKAMKLGADDYLTKPFNYQELLGAIKSQLENIVSSQEEIIELPSQLIHYDQLTGLPNRLLIRQKFEELITSEYLSIFCLSIDRFQDIKEHFGYEIGESVLRKVVATLKQILSAEEYLACLSVNEFLILLTQSEEETLKRAEEILLKLAQPFLIDEQEFAITASIGISFANQERNQIDPLLKQANQGKKLAQRKGGNRYEMNQDISSVSHHQNALLLETELRYVLERNQLTLNYQPQVCLKTGQIVGMEALLRWCHHEWGNISPSTFIPIAEETGLIIPISDWVLEKACEQGKNWKKQFPESTLKMAVNLSAYGFSIPDLCQRIEQTCQRTGFSPHNLELELTESTLVDNFSDARQKLKSLQKLGIKIAIDDFGTGYSSLSYLQQFPFEILKLDRVFVRNLGEDVTNRAIVSALIQLAHGLNLTVVAEGVERKGELSFLQEQKCEYIQGYLFSPPLSVDEMTTLLQENRHLSL